MAEMIFSPGGGFDEHNLWMVPGFIDHIYSLNSGYWHISNHKKHIIGIFFAQAQVINALILRGG